MIAVFLAQGFEEIEALAVVDVLRRAELPVKTVGVGGKEITGAHGICVKADMEEKEVSTDELEAVVLPGGMPGTLRGAFYFRPYGAGRGQRGHLFSGL